MCVITTMDECPQVASFSFLTNFIGLYEYGVDIFSYAMQGGYMYAQKIASKDNKLVYWVAGALSAFSVLLVKKSRRSELAQYVLPRATESLWCISITRHLLPDVKNAKIEFLKSKRNCCCISEGVSTVKFCLFVAAVELKGKMNSMGGKQPKGGYMYFYMAECKRMKEDGTHSGSVTEDVRSKWNSMSDAEKEPYITQSRNDSKEYKERMKAHEKKEVSTRVSTAAAVLGVQNKGKSVVEVCRSKNWKELASKYGLNQKVTYAEVEEDIKSCDSLPAYDRNGVARIRSWGKEEVVRVMAKLKLDRSRKLEMVIVKEVEEAEEADEVVEEMEKEEEMVGGVDDGQGDYEEKMEEMRKKDVTNIYTPESVIDVDLDSECHALHKKKQKVEKAVIPSGIEPVEAAICDYLWNSGLESGVSDVAMLKPSEWVGGVVIDLLAWTVCYDSKKSGRTIGYIPYHIAALDNACNVEGIVSFWGPMLHNYVKFTKCEKIMITINHNNSHWYLLVLDMVDRVVTVYDSLFTSEAAKQRVNDSRRLIYSYNKKSIWVEACGSLGNFSLQRFKFAEHKMNEQSNGHDCGIYMMMWMESIDSRRATGDFVVGEWDHMRILNNFISHNQNQLRVKMTKADMLHKNNKRKG
ncbi:hypothetical protein F3Y22_tig00016212pilonHSYRG00226 [Hibiscus syriacus]|uniref:HMG box domain-containing protein n=1 Tax=Hibiscus syriacus TaxID=106335 RepID=A0A6A3BZI0_HIBSY|nr:hypothetical protein F3Y22_tig00016212pilonHSYRG00226 [Hibiscus syriacus]